MKEVKVTEEKLEEYKDLAHDNPTGFKVIVNEFKKDKLAIISLVVLAVLWIGIFVGAMLLDKKTSNDGRYYEFICTTRRSWTYFRNRPRW